MTVQQNGIFDECTHPQATSLFSDVRDRANLASESRGCSLYAHGFIVNRACLTAEAAGENATFAGITVDVRGGVHTEDCKVRFHGEQRSRCRQGIAVERQAGGYDI